MLWISLWILLLDINLKHSDNGYVMLGDIKRIIYNNLE
jgi:hypothetical protein